MRKKKTKTKRKTKTKTDEFKRVWRRIAAQTRAINLFGELLYSPDRTKTESENFSRWIKSHEVRIAAIEKFLIGKKGWNA